MENIPLEQTPIPQNKEVSVIADPSKRIPKYCTNVSVSKLKNGHVILSFLQKDFTSPNDLEDLNGAVLIERVLIDDEHLGKIIKALNDSLTI